MKRYGFIKETRTWKVPNAAWCPWRVTWKDNEWHCEFHSRRRDICQSTGFRFTDDCPLRGGPVTVQIPEGAK